MVLRVAGSAPGAAALGPIALTDVTAVAARFGEWWTPVTRGESVTLELATASPAALGETTIQGLDTQLEARIADQQREIDELRSTIREMLRSARP